MYDYAYTKETLKDLITKEEGRDENNLLCSKDSNKVNREKALLKASKIAIDGYSCPSSFKSSPCRSKIIYIPHNPEDKLVLRKTGKNIREAFRARAQDRDTIVQNLIRVLQEGVGYCIMRLDIQSCYESFDRDDILNFLASSPHTATTTKHILETLLSSLSVSGLPRGFSLSAALSEARLLEFDKAVREKEKIWFYARFVDDIILVMDKDCDETKIWKDLSSPNFLPSGLSFHESGSDKYSFEKISTVSKNNDRDRAIPIGVFTYLGYEFSIFNDIDREEGLRESVRHIKIDLSKKKIEKNKKMIAKAIADYCKKLNFDLLDKRLRYLTSSRTFMDRNIGAKRRVGLRFSNNAITEEKGFHQLDSFLFTIIHSNRGRLPQLFYRKTSSAQRKKLSRHSFLKGWNDWHFMNINFPDVKIIKECWKYV